MVHATLIFFLDFSSVQAKRAGTNIRVYSRLLDVGPQPKGLNVHVAHVNVGREAIIQPAHKQSFDH
jgi:hypothetical protein